MGNNILSNTGGVNQNTYPPAGKGNSTAQPFNPRGFFDSTHNLIVNMMYQEVDILMSTKLEGEYLILTYKTTKEGESIKDPKGSYPNDVYTRNIFAKNPEGEMELVKTIVGKYVSPKPASYEFEESL